MIRSAILALLLIPGAAFAQEEPSSTLKIDVKLVNVFVTVTDANGAPVARLSKDNF